MLSSLISLLPTAEYDLWVREMTVSGLDLRNPVGVETFNCFKKLCVIERNTNECSRSDSNTKDVHTSSVKKTLNNVYLMNEDALDGATAGVYKFRTQQFNENLLILYANVGDKPVTLTVGEVISKADMCSLGTKVKLKIYSVTKQFNLDRANELWSKLKLEQN